MSNPPSWCKYTAKPSGRFDHMPGVSAGLVAAADVNSQPAPSGGSALNSPAAWSTFWFGAAVVYLVGIYYGMIRVRSSAQ